MKLLYCSRDYRTHDLRFVHTLAGAGFDVAYLRLENDGVPYVREALPAGVRWVEWQGGRAPKPLAVTVTALTDDFHRILEAERPDVVHAGPVPSFGFMAALVKAAPTVLVSWGSDVLVDAHRDAWFARATATAVRHCHGFICDSRAVLDAARTLRGGVLPPHVCIPWGPDRLPSAQDRERRHAQRAALGWEEAIVVVSARAWHPGYRVPQLVEAFAAAARREPRLRLLLLGDGDDAAAIEDTIARSGLSDRIHRPGMVESDALHGWLAAADIYLSLVPSDGTSISLLEAMAHRLAAVVPANAGNAEWVVDGECGLLAPAGDLPAFTDHLLRLAEQPGLRARLGDAAAAVIDARADWTKNASHVVNLYHSVARS
jgi:glycosyltransferase involved in cell wall biosynthesis